MVGSFSPVIRHEPLDLSKPITGTNRLISSNDMVPYSSYKELADAYDTLGTKFLKICLEGSKLESRIRELEAQLETLSPGVTRG